MERDELLHTISAKFPEAVAVVAEPATQLPEVKVSLAQFRGLMEWLHNGDLRFDFPMSMTAVDYLDTKTIVCVYHLYSMDQRHKLVVKVDLDRDKASIPTVSDLWRGCEWFEREVFDLFGVHFEDHPDLRRIMLSDDWVGHPLRKDYKDSRIAGKPY